MSTPEAAINVVHYVERWLPASQTFIHGTVSTSAHRTSVISLGAVENRDRFPVRRLTSLDAVSRIGPVARSRRARAAIVRGIVEMRRADVIHAHFGYRIDDVLGRATGRPVVASLYGHDLTAFVREWPHHYRRAVHEVAAVLVPSNFLRARALDVGFPAERVHVAPPGADLSSFEPSPIDLGSRHVVFAGRLVEKKGVDVLVRAWPLVAAEVSDARLHIVGDGPLSELIDTSDPTITFHRGMAPAAFVAARIRAARVVVTPSRTAAGGDAESQLLVNIEAQAVGRPVVTTDHGGVPEFVERGVTALVVAENDPAALAEAVVQVLTDDALALSLAAAGPTLVARHGLGPCTERIDAISAAARDMA